MPEGKVDRPHTLTFKLHLVCVHWVCVYVGAGMRGCEAADYPRKASACKGQKLGGGVSPPSPPGSAALVYVIQFVN